MSQPILITFDQDLFYERHASETTALSYRDHILAQHITPGLQANYGKIIDFSTSFTTFTALTQSDNQGSPNVYTVHQMEQCGINSVLITTTSTNS